MNRTRTRGGDDYDDYVDIAIHILVSTTRGQRPLRRSRRIHVPRAL